MRAPTNFLRLIRPVAPSTRAPCLLCRPYSSKIAPGETYYSLFPKTTPQGPPPKGPFSIDLRSLQHEFFALQQQSHPDLQKSNTNTPTHSSAYINSAYKTLKDPLSRSQYLLSLRGIDVTGDEGTMFAGESAGGELLMEVMEANEEIDAAESQEEIDALKRTNDERTEQTIKALEEAWKADDIEAAKRETVKLRYWVNIGETLKNWEKSG